MRIAITMRFIADVPDDLVLDETEVSIEEMSLVKKKLQFTRDAPAIPDVRWIAQVVEHVEKIEG